MKHSHSINGSEVVAQHTQAMLNYVLPGQPIGYDLRQPGPAPETLLNHIDAHRVFVKDARTLAVQPTLVTHGFTLINTDFSMPSSMDDATLESTLYPSVVERLAAETGADSVLIFDHTVRSLAPADTVSTYRRAPVKTVHNDYTPQSAALRVQSESERQGVNLSDYARYQLVNLWQPLVHTVEESPLAMADAATFRAQDAHTLPVQYAHRRGEIYAFSYHAGHRWLYYPRMLTDEALLLKVFDSDENAPVRFVPHTAFNDPSTPADAPLRSSIEVRSILLFREV